jgi:uncharacterized membrane protein YkoI
MNKKTIAAAGLLTAGLVAGSFMTIAGANAADSNPTPTSSSTSAPVPPSFKAHAPEEAVTGDLATTLSDLAKAKVAGATVDRVEKDSDGVATYEVHMTKTDGTHVTVNFDANNAITSVDTKPAGGPGGPGGKGGDRTPPAEVTGAIATTLGDLAKAQVAGTVDHIFKDTSNGAAYVVLMTKTDGTRVAVHFDANNAILSVDTPPAGGPRDGKGHGPRDGHGPRGFGPNDGGKDANGGAWTPPTTSTTP